MIWGNVVCVCLFVCLFGWLLLCVAWFCSAVNLFVLDKGRCVNLCVLSRGRCVNLSVLDRCRYVNCFVLGKSRCVTMYD